MTRMEQHRTERVWKVGELAAEAGLTVRTLHHYDRIGLVRPAQRTGSGHRLYTAADVERLYQVLALRQLGLGLDRIADLLAGDVELTQVLSAHRDFLAAQLAAARELHAVVAALAADRPTAANRPVLAVTATTREAEDLAGALRCLLPPDQVVEVGQRVALAGPVGHHRRVERLVGRHQPGEQPGQHLGVAGPEHARGLAPGEQRGLERHRLLVVGRGGGVDLAVGRAHGGAGVAEEQPPEPGVLADGNVRVAQLVSLCLALAGILLIVIRRGMGYARQSYLESEGRVSG